MEKLIEKTKNYAANLSKELCLLKCIESMSAAANSYVKITTIQYKNTVYWFMTQFMKFDPQKIITTIL